MSLQQPPVLPSEESPLTTWLREGREKLHLSSTGAGLKAGLASTAFSYFERDKGVPSSESLAKLEKLLGSVPKEVLDYIEEFRNNRKKEKADFTPPENPTPLQSWVFNGRKKTGLPCQTLSLQLGFGPATLGAYEKGIYVPKTDALKRLTEAFGSLPPDVASWLKTNEEDAKRVPLPRFEPPKNPTPFQAWAFAEREKRQRTRESMSKACGFGVCAWGQYEKGKYLPSDEALKEIERVFGSLPPEVMEWILEKRKTFHPVYEREHAKTTPLSRWLIEERLKRKLTQEQLCGLLNLPARALKDLEVARKLPSRKRLQVFIDYFGGIPPEVLTWFENEAKRARFKRFLRSEEDVSPFGAVIRQLRQKANMSQVELAEHLGRDTKSFVQRLENGSLRVSEDTLRDLAHIFGYAEVPGFWRQLLVESEQEWHHRREREPEEIRPLGQEIRRLRQVHHLTQEKLAKRLGWRIEKLQQYELAKASVPDEAMDELARAFGYPEAPYHWTSLRFQSGQECQGPSGAINKNLSPFGKMLRYWRQETQVTQEELSRLLGMTGTYVHEVEYGRATITEKRLILILRHLGKEDQFQQAAAKISEGHQWMLPQGLQIHELPESGQDYRAQRLADKQSIPAKAEAEGTKEWKVAERERGKRLTWRQKKEQREGKS